MRIGFDPYAVTVEIERIISEIKAIPKTTAVREILYVDAGPSPWLGSGFCAVVYYVTARGKRRLCMARGDDELAALRKLRAEIRRRYPKLSRHGAKECDGATT